MAAVGPIIGFCVCPIQGYAILRDRLERGSQSRIPIMEGSPTVPVKVSHGRRAHDGSCGDIESSRIDPVWWEKENVRPRQSQLEEGPGMRHAGGWINSWDEISTQERDKQWMLPDGARSWTGKFSLLTFCLVVRYLMQDVNVGDYGEEIVHSGLRPPKSESHFGEI